jgi:hypothetical protein
MLNNGFVDFWFCMTVRNDHKASMGVEGADLLFYSMTPDWKAMKGGKRGFKEI